MRARSFFPAVQTPAFRRGVLALALALVPATASAAPKSVPAPARSAAVREAVPARMLEEARRQTDDALKATGQKRIAGLRAALDTLIDIVERHPGSDLAVLLGAGKRVQGLSIADLSTLLAGLTDADPLTAQQAEILADAHERAAREGTLAGNAAAAEETGDGAPAATGSVRAAAPATGIVELEAPSTPPVDERIALSPEEAVAACDRLAASPNDAARTQDGIWQTVMDAPAAILACTQAVKARPDNGRLKFQLGRAVYRTGQLTDAALLFGKAAAQGHMAAQAQLGLMLIAGEGTARDAGRGFALVKGAADAGDPFAIAMLGELTARGIATARDAAAGEALYRKAAERGSPVGMQRLGEALAAKMAGPETDARALDWLNKAADAGAPTAHYQIGVLHRDGRAVPKSASAALSHFRLAAMAGDTRALYEVGAAYINGRGVRADQREGVSWMRRAAEAGLSDSYYSLAYAHAFGRGAERNAREAARYMYMSLQARSDTAYGQMTRNFEQWPPDMRRELQQMMKEGGIYASSIDGSFGPATFKAIATLTGN